MLITINKAFIQKSDHLKQWIEKLEESSETETESGSKSESDLNSKLNSKSYIKSNERPKSNKKPKRIQSNRKVKLKNIHLKEARVLFIFFYN